MYKYLIGFYWLVCSVGVLITKGWESMFYLALAIFACATYAIIEAIEKNGE